MLLELSFYLKRNSLLMLNMENSISGEKPFKKISLIAIMSFRFILEGHSIKRTKDQGGNVSWNQSNAPTNDARNLGNRSSIPTSSSQNLVLVLTFW